MRTLIAVLSILAATTLVLCVAPQMIDLCAAFIADVETYLEWIIEGRTMGNDLIVLFDGSIQW